MAASATFALKAGVWFRSAGPASMSTSPKAAPRPARRRPATCAGPSRHPRNLSIFSVVRPWDRGDRTHGQQFKARFLRTSPPTSADGIEKYLSSGMIRGIGPAYAKKLLRAFGEKVFDLIEAAPDRLREVDGIGPVRAASILAAWAEQKAVREIMVFLHSHGVGTARAVRIYKTYGSDAIQVMTENPYRLARDIRGIGFKTADAIAMKLGIEKTAIVRVRAGISHALTEAMDEGHCGLPTEELIPLAER